MKRAKNLPEGYSEILSIDLQEDKRLALLVNGLALLIGVLMAVPMHFYIPITSLFDLEAGLVPFVLKLASLLLLTVVYMVLHELVHGIAMKICGTEKVKYGFTGMYAFAGSDDYYGKGAYIFIALAPVVLWGIVLAVINIFVSPAWFWVVYFIQITNISGAAGDMYVTSRFCRLPKDIIVRDSGVGMRVFSKESE